MPWKQTLLLEARTRFVLAVKAGLHSFARLSREFGISRQAAYKWWRRYRHGGIKALDDLSRRPHRPAGQYAGVWKQRLRIWRHRYPSWGPKKLRRGLQQTSRGAAVPATSTLARWLRELKLIGLRPRRARGGPAIPRVAFTQALEPNDVWTVDFKGWFRTGDGTRCEPLTVRDLSSRVVLGIRLLPDQSDGPVRAYMTRLFCRFGLPRVIRVDNGTPFGGGGALGLSRLSVWWLRLGIRVEFIRRAHPEDNGGHEQMHRILKAETLHPPARTPRGQQARITRWVTYYNRQRPHEGLNQQMPAQHYCKSPRRFPRQLPQPRYPADWTVRRVRPHGDIKWHGRLRFIGRAFVGQRVGLKPVARGVEEIHLAEHLIGLLHATDAAGMRPAHQVNQIAPRNCQPCHENKLSIMS